MPPQGERDRIMKVSDVARALESLAPVEMAAEWDNVGLLVGDAAASVRKLLLCIDLTEDVLAEAVAAKAQMVMAYHPPIFKPISRLTAAAEPVVYAAARRGVAVYSMHTALDVAPGGTNDVLADAMGLVARRPLTPVVCRRQCKVVVFAAPGDLPRVSQAAFEAGAGRIGNYNECAFFCHGIGSFYGGAGSAPAVGEPGRHEAVEELRLEMIVPAETTSDVVAAIRATHSYEEPSIDVYPLEDHPEGYGMGRVGSLGRPATTQTLIARIKKATGVNKLLVAGRPSRPGGVKKPALVRTVACAAGSCGELYRAAAQAGATFYLTGEMRHHDALGAEAAGLTVVCLGHSNSERITLVGLAKLLQLLLPKLPVTTARHDRDPFQIA